MKFPTLYSWLVASALCVLTLFPHAARSSDKETWLGLPVEFSNREYAFKSGVSVELAKVTIQTSTPIEIERAWIRPDWADWITEFRTSRVRAETGMISARPSSLARLGVIDGPSTRKVTRLEFSGLKLMLGSKSLNLPAGEMRFAPDGALSIIRIVMESGPTLELAPKEGKLTVLVQAGATKFAVLPAFSFDSVAAQGEITDDYILLDRIGANGDGGSISGSLRLLAAERFILEGDLKMESLRARDVVGRLYSRSTLDGILGGSFKLSAVADTFEALGTNAVFTGTYVVRNGSLDRFGLVEGMRRSGSGVVGGGLLRFDTLGGKFSGRSGEPAQADFQGLSSGALRGSSSFTVMPDGKLRGKVFGSWTVTGGESFSRSFDLSGTVSAPSLSVK